MADLKTDEPVLVGAAALATVSTILEVLVTHGVITKVQASSLTQTLVPLVTVALTMLAGVLIRRLTTPWRKVQASMVKDGLTTDADVARITQAVADVIDSRLAPELPDEPDAPVAATEADLAEHVAAPDGMDAGAPA